MAVQQLPSVYLSASAPDAQIAEAIRARLAEAGVPVRLAPDVRPGGNSFEQLVEAIRGTDIYVPLITTSVSGLSAVITELGAIRSVASKFGRPLLIPIVWGPARAPVELGDIEIIHAPHGSVDAVSQQLFERINFLAGEKAVEQRRDSVIEARVDAASPGFIDDALVALARAESRERQSATRWHRAGITFLALGVGFGLWGLFQLTSMASLDWMHVAVAGVKTIVIATFLGACARYAFALGTAHAAEERKAADRAHAISFGQFYLRVFGSTAEWKELKEVFQHWNIDRSASPASLSPSDIDPKIVDSFAALIRAARADSKP